MLDPDRYQFPLDKEGALIRLVWVTQQLEEVGTSLKDAKIRERLERDAIMNEYGDMSATALRLAADRGCREYESIVDGLASELEALHEERDLCRFLVEHGL